LQAIERHQRASQRQVLACALSQFAETAGNERDIVRYASNSAGIADPLHCDGSTPIVALL
jgi:hypothetical protein